ncbi:MAG TPA: chromate transporter [Steroidobacteraceae bacterium]|nr:chromate transporter [Steroidobacteraceae bacterium]
MSAPDPSAEWPARSASPLGLFIAFSQMALSGFGGVMPFAYRSIVERHRWYTPAEFAELLAFGQVLPGPSICNVAVMIGWKKAGFAGALAALAGMLVGPSIAVVALGVLYAHYDRVAPVQRALSGMSAAAAGLIIAMAVNMGTGLFTERTPLRTDAAIGIGLIALAFVAVGLAHWPMLLVIGVLGPLGIGAAWWRST